MRARHAQRTRRGWAGDAADLAVGRQDGQRTPVGVRARAERAGVERAVGGGRVAQLFGDGERLACERDALVVAESKRCEKQPV